MSFLGLCAKKESACFRAVRYMLSPQPKIKFCILLLLQTERFLFTAKIFKEKEGRQKRFPALLQLCVAPVAHKFIWYILLLTKKHAPIIKNNKLYFF